MVAWWGAVLGELHATFVDSSPGGGRALPLVALLVAQPLAQPVAQPLAQAVALLVAQPVAQPVAPPLMLLVAQPLAPLVALLSVVRTKRVRHPILDDVWPGGLWWGCEWRGTARRVAVPSLGFCCVVAVSYSPTTYRLQYHWRCRA